MRTRVSFSREVNARVAELVDFLERFLHDELQESLLVHVSVSAELELRELQGIAQRLRERHQAEWLVRVEPYTKLTRRKLAELADEAKYHPKHNPDGRLYACRICGADSVAQVEPDVGICTVWKCREVRMLATCDRCGGVKYPGAVYCEDCMGYIHHQLDKDD